MSSSFNRIRLQDGVELALAEWLHQPVFSTVEFAAADPLRLVAFNYTRGGQVSHTPTVAARNATEADTNLVKRKAMNQDEALIVFAVHYEIFSLATVADGSGANKAIFPMTYATDLRRLQRDAIFELYVGAGIKKPQVQVPFVSLTQSMGSPAWVSGDRGATATSVTYGTGGPVTTRNQRMYDLPIYIGGFGEQARPGNSMYFQAKFFNGRGGVIAGLVGSYRIRFVLDGLKKRPA